MFKKKSISELRCVTVAKMPKAKKAIANQGKARQEKANAITERHRKVLESIKKYSIKVKTKEVLLKKVAKETGYAPSTINSLISKIGRDV